MTTDSELELTLRVVPSSGKMSLELQAVYEGLPGNVVADIERSRMAIQFATVTHLMRVRDLFDDPKRFHAWCDALGMAYSSVVSAIRKYEYRLMEEGRTTTPSGRPITPYIRQGPLQINSEAHKSPRQVSADVLWALRRILARKDFDDIFPLFQKDVLRWVQTQQEGSQVDIQNHCVRLASLLLEVAQTRIVDERKG